MPCGCSCVTVRKLPMPPPRRRLPWSGYVKCGEPPPFLAWSNPRAAPRAREESPENEWYIPMGTIPGPPPPRCCGPGPCGPTPRMYGAPTKWLKRFGCWLDARMGWPGGGWAYWMDAKWPGLEPSCIEWPIRCEPRDPESTCPCPCDSSVPAASLVWACLRPAWAACLRPPHSASRLLMGSVIVPVPPSAKALCL
eukprot:scaffold11393_cov30-Tisochrysis_lutea.AAC.1